MAPGVPAATCLEHRRCREGAYGFQHPLLLTAHNMSSRPGSGGQWHSCPSGSLLLHILGPPQHSSQPLCFSLRFLLLLLCSSLSPSLSGVVPQMPALHRFFFLCLNPKVLLSLFHELFLPGCLGLSVSPRTSSRAGFFRPQVENSVKLSVCQGQH